MYTFYRSPIEGIGSRLVQFLIISGLLLFLAPSLSEAFTAASPGSGTPSYGIIPMPLGPSGLASPLINNHFVRYPAGYMHREPVILEPALSIFAPGSMVKMTDRNLFKDEADIDNYFHVRSSDMTALSAGDEIISP